MGPDGDPAVQSGLNGMCNGGCRARPDLAEIEHSAVQFSVLTIVLAQSVATANLPPSHPFAAYLTTRSSTRAAMNER